MNKDDRAFLSRFGTRVTFDRTERMLYGHDIAAIPRLVKPLIGNTLPDAVVQPESEQELKDLVVWAAKEKVPLTPRGRAAFYAAARQIYLEEPEGADGFWPRLQRLDVPALFVWGRRDTLVPLAFARHVSEAVPKAEHLELDCGHVPQMERPRETHAAIERFFLS